MEKRLNKYLFKLPPSTYNNEKSFYEIPTLPGSDISKTIVFCGMRSMEGDLPRGVVYVYLELKEELTEKNQHNNLYLLLNLIWLATGLPIDSQQIKLKRSDDFKDVYKKFKCKKFYYRNMNFGGLVRDKSPIGRVVGYVSLMQKIKSGDLMKFEDALNTYIWAKEIGRLPNPHLKYTLFMTLYLSSINQLANDPEKCDIQVVCSGCKKDLTGHFKTSHVNEIELLIRELITGNNVDSAVKIIKDLYHPLRSSFLHSGLLHGSEKKGGFLFDSKSEIKLVENMANIEILNRQLLEQFLVRRSEKKSIAKKV